jgi:predicted nucleic-acid-binding Zn-ribbon protein
MKRTKRCPRCGGREVGLLEALDEVTTDDRSYVAVGVMRYRPEYVSPAHLKQQTGKVLKQDSVSRAPETTTKAGTVEAYLCARCGYLERYVQDPTWMPFERLEGFTWVNGEERS